MVLIMIQHLGAADKQANLITHQKTASVDQILQIEK